MAARGCSWCCLAPSDGEVGRRGETHLGLGGTCPSPAQRLSAEASLLYFPIMSFFHYSDSLLPGELLHRGRAPTLFAGSRAWPVGSAERASESCSRDLLGGCVACWLPRNGRISHILINTSLAPSSSAPLPEQTGINSACCLACSGLEGLIPWTWVGALLRQPGRVLGREAAHPGHAAPRPPAPPQPPGALPCSVGGGALAAVPSAQLTPAWFPVSWAPSTLPASSCAPAGHSPSLGHGRATCTRGGPAVPHLLLCQAPQTTGASDGNRSSAPRG